ncbi:MAG: hypothetical protein R2823_10825 [Acidimicrobiia bacterium]
MTKAMAYVAGSVLLAGFAMSLVAVIAVSEGPTQGCQSGPMKFDALLASESIIGVTRHDAFADRPGLAVWAPGTVAKATAVWGVPADEEELATSGGRFSLVAADEERCATQRLGTSRYEITYQSEGGPHVLAAITSTGEETELTRRFGQPATDPVQFTDRLVANAALWAGPIATIGAVLIAVAAILVFVEKRRAW